jgi:hypothetical protein
MTIKRGMAMPTTAKIIWNPRERAMRVRAARRLVISHHWICYPLVSYSFLPAQCRFVWTNFAHVLDKKREIFSRRYTSSQEK